MSEGIADQVGTIEVDTSKGHLFEDCTCRHTSPRVLVAQGERRTAKQHAVTLPNGQSIEITYYDADEEPIYERVWMCGTCWHLSVEEAQSALDDSPPPVERHFLVEEQA